MDGIDLLVRMPLVSDFGAAARLESIAQNAMQSTAYSVIFHISIRINVEGRTEYGVKTKVFKKE